MSDQQVACIQDLGYIDEDGNFVWHQESEPTSAEARLSAIEQQMDRLEQLVKEHQRAIDNLAETLRQWMMRHSPTVRSGEDPVRAA